MRAPLAAIFLCLSTACASADMVTIRSKSGATAKVAASHASKFQCLVDKIDNSGYRIRVLGGYRRGICSPPRHKHPCGLALDIDQTARDVTLRGFPRSQSTQFAKQCGLHPGSLWNHADTGHFEVPSSSRYAAPQWPRVISHLE